MRPVFLSSIMAKDIFVKDCAINGERDFLKQECSIITFVFIAHS